MAGVGGEADSCLDIFPVEVWERIFQKLKPDDLLTARVVCRVFKDLVDDVFEPIIWKPYFARNRVADVLSRFLIKCKGTRFSKAEQVDEFFAETEGITSTSQSPFINKTVILCCQSVQDYALLCEKFPAIVERYSDHIRHCLYFVHNEVPLSVANIPIIFQLKNLRSLTIYCADWDKKWIRAGIDLIRPEMLGTPPLKHFTTLNVLGDRGFMVVRPLFFGYGPQIQRLNCWGHNLLEEASRGFARAMTETFSNLQEFKICDISCHLLTSLSRGNWPLKRLSVKMGRSDDIINLGCVMDAVNRFSPTLEALYLQVEERQLNNNVFQYPFNFPHVTDLRLPYYLNRRFTNDLGDITRRFMNVKHLELVDTEDRYGKLMGRGNHEETIGEVVNRLWTRLPQNVESITVRYRNCAETRKDNSSIVHKYRRTRADYNGNGQGQNQNPN